MLFDTNSLSLSLSYARSLVLSFSPSLSIFLSLYINIIVKVNALHLSFDYTFSLFCIKNMHAEHFEHTIGRFEIPVCISKWVRIMQ